MVRVGGMGYTIDVDAAMGNRISQHAPPGLRRADRGREGLRRGRLGLGQRRTPRARPSGTWSPRHLKRPPGALAAAAQVRSRSCAPAADCGLLRQLSRRATSRGETGDADTESTSISAWRWRAW